MSGTQCYTLSYFPSLRTGKRVRDLFTGEAPDGMGKGGRIGYTNLSRFPWLFSIPRTSSLSWDWTSSGKVSMCSSNLHTQVLPEVRLWSQYVVTADCVRIPLREGAIRCGPPSSTGTVIPTLGCVDTWPDSSSYGDYHSGSWTSLELDDNRLPKGLITKETPMCGTLKAFEAPHEGTVAFWAKLGAH